MSTRILGEVDKFEVEIEGIFLLPLSPLIHAILLQAGFRLNDAFLVLASAPPQASNLGSSLISCDCHYGGRQSISGRLRCYFSAGKQLTIPRI